MSDVKKILMTAKNRLFLAITAATALFVKDIEASAKEFTSTLDSEKFTKDLQTRTENLNLATDLYPEQAEYELTEFLKGYEDEIARLTNELTALTEINATLNAELDKSIEQVRIVTEEKKILQSDIALKLADYDAAIETQKALYADISTLKEQRDSYKSQYEAAIADEGIQLDNLGSAEYVPPAGNKVEEEETTDPYIIAARTLKQLKAKQNV